MSALPTTCIASAPIFSFSGGDRFMNSMLGWPACRPTAQVRVQSWGQVHHSPAPVDAGKRTGSMQGEADGCIIMHSMEGTWCSACREVCWEDLPGLACDVWAPSLHRASRAGCGSPSRPELPADRTEEVSPTSTARQFCRWGSKEASVASDAQLLPQEALAPAAKGHVPTRP